MENPIEEKPIEQEVIELKNKDIKYEIENNDDLDRLSNWLKTLKGMSKKVSEKFDPIVENAYKTHKEATALRKSFLDPIKEVVEKITNSVLKYHARMEKERIEAEELVNKELARKAEEIKQKLIKESETAENEWDKEIAKEKAAQIVPQTVMTGPSDFKKQEGMSVRKNWRAKIVDINLVPMEYCLKEANMPMLHALAKKEEKPSTIPGVEFFNDANLAVKS